MIRFIRRKLRPNVGQAVRQLTLIVNQLESVLGATNRELQENANLGTKEAERHQRKVNKLVAERSEITTEAEKAQKILDNMRKLLGE